MDVVRRAPRWTHLIVPVLLVVTSCHSIDENVFAHAPVPLEILPLRDPITYTTGALAGEVVPLQNGLLASYFSGANYVYQDPFHNPPIDEQLDHQQIDPNIDFIWDASDTNPVISSAAGIDHSDGDPRLPDHWPIWSVVWEGYLDAPVDGTYGLRLHVNNGGWLEMEQSPGTLHTIIDCAGGTGFEGDCDAAATLTAGRRYIRVSYYNNSPPTAVALFSWQPPGAPDFEIVPTGRLFTQRSAANTAPLVILPGPQELFMHDGVSVSGSFADPDTGQTWTGSVDYPDSAGPIPLELAEDHTFQLGHRFTSPGIYRVSVTITDSAGGVGTASLVLTIRPKRAMLYVHGTSGSFVQNRLSNDFPSLFTRLFDRYGLVRFFEYREDRGNQNPDQTCRPGAQRPIPPISPAAGLPLDPPTPDPAPGICDSNDDIELNGVVLDADVRALAAEFDRVTVMSNSGGGGIVRAFLAYSKAADTGALALLDEVVFMQGVQAGSYLTLVYDGLDTAIDANPSAATVRDALLDQVREQVGHDPTRPVFEDLRPRSAIIRYTNVSVPVPNEPHYVNVVSNIRLHVMQSFFLIPIQTDVVEVGDLAILVGENDPRQVPERGGARFLPSAAGRGQSSTQWELTRDFDVNVDPTVPGGVKFLFQIADIMDAPEIHTNLGAKLNSICVRTGAGGVAHLDQALYDTIAAMDSGLTPATSRLGFGERPGVACP